MSKPKRAKVSKLLANIKAIGLIEPLCVCQEGDQYFIIDGYVRLSALAWPMARS
jgi:ParB-like chromosome segregation protein Spo0J